MRIFLLITHMRWRMRDKGCDGWGDRKHGIRKNEKGSMEQDATREEAEEEDKGEGARESQGQQSTEETARERQEEQNAQAGHRGDGTPEREKRRRQHDAAVRDPEGTATGSELLQSEKRTRSQDGMTADGRNAMRKQTEQAETGTTQAGETSAADGSDSATPRQEEQEANEEAQRRRLGKRKVQHEASQGEDEATHRDHIRRRHEEEQREATHQERRASDSAKRRRDEEPRDDEQHRMQQHNQCTTAMHQEPSTAHTMQPRDQEGYQVGRDERNSDGETDSAREGTPEPEQHRTQQQNPCTAAMHQESSNAHSMQPRDQEGYKVGRDVRNGDGENSSANDDTRGPRDEHGASGPTQQPTSRGHHGSVGEPKTQDRTVNDTGTGRGHTQRKQREFFTGIVRDTPPPRPTAPRTSPPAGPAKRRREETYMTPHKARRGVLRYAIGIGPQLVARIRTLDDTEQQ